LGIGADELEVIAKPLKARNFSRGEAAHAEIVFDKALASVFIVPGGDRPSLLGGSCNRIAEPSPCKWVAEVPGFVFFEARKEFLTAVVAGVYTGL
jgi:hypothetical protein